MPCSAMIRANSAGFTIAVPSNAGVGKWRLLPVRLCSADRPLFQAFITLGCITFFES